MPITINFVDNVTQNEDVSDDDTNKNDDDGGVRV